jgi:hypothetical protein
VADNKFDDAATVDRDRVIQMLAKIFEVPSEVMEKPHAVGDGVEWRSVVSKRKVQRVEGHDGLKDFELEESESGWGHVLKSDHLRRVKGFRISPEAFIEALSTQSIGDLSWTKVTRGLPSGSQVLGATYELASRCWIVYVEHPDFPEIESGVRAPLCEIVFHKLHFAGLIQRLKGIERLVEQCEDAELIERVRLHLATIMKQYFPEEVT